jgi:potassium-dependent mechanosensitive channel
MRLVIHTEGWRHAVLFTAFLLLTSVSGDTAEPKSADAPQTVVPPPPKTILVTEVARQATEVANLLRIYRAKLVPNPDVEVIRKLVSQVGEDIDIERADTMTILSEQPTLELLQTQDEVWQRRQLQLTGWLNLLTARATELQSMLNLLAQLQKTWADTGASAQATKAPESILQQIETTRAAIEAAQAPIQAQRAVALDLQSQVAKEVDRCSSVLAQIDELQDQAVAGILVRDGLPLWSPELWAKASSTTLSERVRKVATAYRAGILKYLHDPSQQIPLHLGLVVVLSLVFWAARRQFDHWTAAGETASSSVRVFDRPYAAALFITLFFVTSPLSQAPTTVREVFRILAFVPIILLTRPVVVAELVPGLYALGLLFAIDTVRQPFGGAPLISQGILVCETLVGMGVARWLLRRMRNGDVISEDFSRFRLLRLGTYLFLFTFAVALVATITGYVRLASLLTSGIIGAGVMALAFYVSVRLASGLFAFALRVWPLSTLRMVLHHRDLLERRVYHLLLWLAVVGWLARYLDYVGLLEPAQSLGQAVLAAKLERGSISISVGDVLAFFLTLVAAYLLSSFIRFMLEEDVYPRTRISAGVSYAASSVLNYAILAIGFVVALGVLGMDLTKMTVLAGAFGVGIGFGLQSVVNNFVSGLILLFERPIHVGDTVQVGSLQGRVLRIGIRASVVRTPLGAEIIVPNAQLITEQVTNWTLSDQLRRIDLPVGVSYGTEPKKVIELLQSVARAHPEVLQNPAPRALFTGYGDSSINFELRAWADFANWVQVHSDLTVAVYDAVYAAGMTFPFPQRDVHIVSHDDSKSTIAPEKVADKKT